MYFTTLHMNIASCQSFKDEIWYAFFLYAFSMFVKIIQSDLFYTHIRDNNKISL